MSLFTAKRFLLQLLSLYAFFDAKTVLSLLVTDSQVTQRPSAESEELPLLTSPDTQDRLSQLFLKCSTECSGLPDCLGITIYKLNSESGQLADSTDSFTCLPTINDDLNNLQPGKLFYKVMFRDKLPKFNRRNFVVRNSREIHPENAMYNQRSLRKRDLPMVDPLCATAATKIEPIKIDPLFTGTTVAGPNNAPLHVPCTSSLLGENKASSSEFSNQGLINSPSTTTADFSSSVISRSHSKSESSSEGISSGFKSSAIPPVKINKAFTDTTAFAGSTVDPKSVQLHVPSTDSLFGENKSSSSAEISKEGIINSPSTVTAEGTSNSGHLSSSSSLGISSGSENSSKESSASNNIFESPAISPVKIDTTVDSGISPIHTPVALDTDSLFGENKSSITSEISKEGISRNPSATTAEVTANSGNLSSFSSSRISSSQSNSENSSKGSSVINTFKTSAIPPVKIMPAFTDSATFAGVTVDSNNVPLHVPSTDSLFGENKLSSSVDISNKGMINGPSTTTVEGTANSGHLSSFSSSGISSSSSHSNPENSSELSSANNTFKSSSAIPTVLPAFTDSATFTGVTVDPNSVPLHVPTDSLFGENISSTTSEISKEGISSNHNTPAAEGTANSGNLSFSSSGMSSSHSNSENSSKGSSAINTFKSSAIPPVKIMPVFTDSATFAGVVDSNSVPLHVPSTDSLFGENKSSSSADMSNKGMINSPSATTVEGTANSGHLSSSSSSGISSSSESSSKESNASNNTFESSATSPVKIHTTVDSGIAPLHTPVSVVNENIPIITDSINRSSAISSLLENSGKVTTSKTEQGGSLSIAVPISATTGGDRTATHSSTTGSDTASSISENASENAISTIASTPDAEISQNSALKINSLFTETTTAPIHPKESFVTVPGETLVQANVSSSDAHIISTPLSYSSLPATHHIFPIDHDSTTVFTAPAASESSTAWKSAAHDTSSGSISEHSSNSADLVSNNLSHISSAASSMFEGANAIASINNYLISAENSGNKASENLASSKIDDIGVTTSNAGENAVTEITLDGKDTVENADEPLFGNGESTTDLSGTRNRLQVDNTIKNTAVETTSKDQFQGQSNDSHDYSATSQSQTSTNHDDSNVGGAAFISLAKDKKVMTIGIPTLVKCNDNDQSSEDIQGQSGAIMEIPLVTPETHSEIQTGSASSEDSNSHRVYAGESSGEKASGTIKNEYSYLPYESSNSHQAGVSEVKNQDGTTSLVLTTVVKIKVEDDDSSDVSSDSYHMASTDSPAQTVTYKVAEEPVTTFKTLLESQSTDMECRFQDTERYLRNIRGTAYSILNGCPTLLSFVSGVQSHCVGTLMKNGTRGMRGIESIIPEFPSNIEVEAAGFLNNKLYVIDSSKEQIVWSSDYDFNTRQYSEMHEGPIRQCVGSTKQEFLQMCQINALASEIRIKAFAQVSLQDNSCIIFDESRQPILSDNASDEARSLARAISFLLETEFINYVEAVFSWLDESFISSVYVYGSDGDLFRLFRNATTDFQWQNGNYELLPYPELPLKP